MAYPGPANHLYVTPAGSIKVLRSEMEQGYQKRVLAMSSAKAKEVGKAGDLDSLVAAIKVNER